MRSLIRGLRSGVALLRSTPAAAFAAIAALGLGIGASTTMFSIVHGATRTLPFADADDIVAIQRSGAGGSMSSIADFELWRSQSRSFEALGAFQTESRNLSAAGEAPERLPTATISLGALELLRVQPIVGRGFTAADIRPGAERPMLISHAVWTRRYGSDPAIIGRIVRVDGAPHIVIGVMPPRFGFPINASLWTPLPAANPATAAERVEVFGRLAGGTTLAAARSELLGLARAATLSEDERAAIALNVTDFAELEIPLETRWGLYLLLLASSGVLIVACVNVASLFIARAVARSRDVAVMLALGAERRHILIEQVAESVVFSALAATAGLAMAWAGTRAFRIGSADVLEAFWMDFRLDGTVVIYASLLAACAAAGAATIPALRASRTDVIGTLRDGGIGASSLRIGRVSRGLLGVQIAMASALLAFSVLLGQTSLALHARAWPFDPDTLLTAQLGVPRSMLDDEEARLRLLDQLEESLHELPGARATTLTSALPGRGSGNRTFSFDGPETDRTRQLSTGLTMVSTSYFDTLGARPLAGRVLTDQDRPGAPIAAIANQSFVRRYSAERNPIGRRVFLGTSQLMIVGVVPDLMPNDVDRHEQDGLYVSIRQMRPLAVRLMVAVESQPLGLAGPLRIAVDRVNPDLTLFEVFTARQAALRDKQVLDVISSLFGVFGAGALLLTAVGLYSVTAFSIAQRRREFGIRVALGATRADLLRMLTWQSTRQIGAGLSAGALLAVAMTRGFSAAVAVGSPNSTMVIGAVVAGLLLTSALAIAVPVMNAANTGAMTPLRESL